MHIKADEGSVRRERSMIMNCGSDLFDVLFVFVFFLCGRFNHRKGQSLVSIAEDADGYIDR